MSHDLFAKFAPHIERLGESGLDAPELCLGSDNQYKLQYIPFEHVNSGARLVLVGITPGPDQIKLAYRRTQELLRKGLGREQILLDVKKIAAFGGPNMRPNLVQMLNHFGFGNLLGIDDVNSLWAESAHLLHSTSIIPHAAFAKKTGKPFAESFLRVKKSSLLWKCFLEAFIPTLSEINRKARYVALGPTPGEALNWCVANGYLESWQVLGQFAHPSRNGGSQVPYFLRQRTRGQLKAGDPVLRRCDRLDRAYEEMQRSVEAWRSSALALSSLRN